MLTPIYCLKFRDLDIISCYSLHKFLLWLPQGLLLPSLSVPGPEHQPCQHPRGSLCSESVLSVNAHSNWAGTECSLHPVVCVSSSAFDKCERSTEVQPGIFPLWQRVLKLIFPGPSHHVEESWGLTGPGQTGEISLKKKILAFQVSVGSVLLVRHYFSSWLFI